MTKYAPLSGKLTQQTAPIVRMTIPEIEQTINDTLPPSARLPGDPRWWQNHPSTAQGRAWLRAGYRVETVDRATDVVTFSRI